MALCEISKCSVASMMATALADSCSPSVSSGVEIHASAASTHAIASLSRSALASTFDAEKKLASAPALPASRRSAPAFCE